MLWVLKCDIRKFFASINQKILLDVVSRHVPDPDIQWLIGQVVNSFCSCGAHKLQIHSFNATAWNQCMYKGLPLGNLTSQLLVNIYMNEFDQYVKHKLKAKYYVRYADDFVILSHDREQLVRMERYIGLFLRGQLKLELHPDKVFIKTFASGIDFLGWVHFSDHRVLRTGTKRRMIKRTASNPVEASVASYLGLLKHGNGQKLSDAIRKVTLA